MRRSPGQSILEGLCHPENHRRARRAAVGKGGASPEEGLFDFDLWLVPCCSQVHWYLLAVFNPGAALREDNPAGARRLLQLE